MSDTIFVEWFGTPSPNSLLQSIPYATFTLPAYMDSAIYRVCAAFDAWLGNKSNKGPLSARIVWVHERDNREFYLGYPSSEGFMDIMRALDKTGVFVKTEKDLAVYRDMKPQPEWVQKWDKAQQEAR